MLDIPVETLQFGNLPLLEVAIRVVPMTELPLSVSSIQRVLAAPIALFTGVEDLERLEKPPGSPDFKFKPMTFNGFVLTSHQAGITADIQTSMITLRWRKAVSNAPTYPRFPAMLDYLREVLSLLAKSLELPAFGVRVVNLSYMNFIDDRKQLALRGVSIPLMNIAVSNSTVVEGEATVTDLNIGWSEQEMSADVRVRLEQAELTGLAVGAPPQPGAMLTTICGSFVPPEANFEEKLLLCHNRLIRLFRELVDADTLVSWGYNNV
jgi:hypothetical protein